MSMRRALKIALLAGTLLLTPALLPAATTPTPVFVQTPKLGSCTFVQGTDSAGTYKTCYTGGANGTKITGIWISSNDGSASHLVTVQVSTSTSAHCSPQSNCLGGAAVTVPVNSGFAAGAGAVNVMSAANWPGLPIDSDGNPYIYLTGSTMTIEVTFATALTASTQLAVSITAGDF